MSEYYEVVGPIPINTRVIRKINGVAAGIGYTIENYTNGLPQTESSTCTLQSAVEQYRKKLFESPHYRLELGMYCYSGTLLFRDYARRAEDPSDINHFLQEIYTPGSPPNNLYAALSDYLLLGYAYDDLLDNSPLRGESTAYHVLTSSSQVTDMYWYTRGRLIEICNTFNPKGAAEVDKLITSYDGAAKSEDSNHCYYIDLDGEHKPEVAFKSLSNKAKFLSSVVTRPFIFCAGIEVPEIWGEGLQSGYEAAWLVNDLYKNAAGNGLAMWIELKQGRLPLPVTLALHSLNDTSKQQLITVINDIWNYCRPYFSDRAMNLQTIPTLKNIDKTPSLQDNLSLFAALINSAGIYQTINGEITPRRDHLLQISEYEGGLSHLDFFDATLALYLLRKRLRLGLREVKSSLRAITKSLSVRPAGFEPTT